ncbi:MAG: hypothetical protein MJZ28_11195 [Paludibacteraceae bacterium]|nr:hypothetical protein [Paludibacteraceae bacterium]
MNKQLLCKGLTVLIALLSISMASAKSLQIGGVTVATSNADDVLGDGSVKYDASTNTLMIKQMNLNSNGTSFAQVTNTSSDISVNETSPLTVICDGYNVYKGTETGVVGIQYAGSVVFKGGGIMEMTTDSSAIICGHLKVMNGTVVELYRNEIGQSVNHFGKGYTLKTDSISVDSSYLYVHKGKSDYAVNSSATYFRAKGCSSNAELIHRSVETRVSERYEYAFNNLTNTYDYRYRTVSKWKSYDGWYDSNNSYVSELIVKPKSYSVWIDGVQVDMYNYLDVLGDGMYSYSPLTKTLTSQSIDGDIKFNGYLVVVDYLLNETKYFAEDGNGDTMQASKPQNPSYVSRYSDDKENIHLAFWTLVDTGDNYDFAYHDVTEGDFSFPGLAKGKITFDKDTYTLTLEDVECSCESGLWVSDHSLTINLIGSNTFYSVINTDLSIQASHINSLKFTGSGSIDCTQLYVPEVDSVFVTDGCTVSTNYILGDGILTIDNSTLDIKGDTLWDCFSGIDRFHELNLIGVGMSNDSISFQPEFSAWKTIVGIVEIDSKGKLRDLNGIPYKGILTISPTFYTSAPMVKKEDVWDPTAPKYDLLGRPVYDKYRGIYIQNGKKFKSIYK